MCFLMSNNKCKMRNYELCAGWISLCYLVAIFYGMLCRVKKNNLKKNV